MYQPKSNALNSHGFRDMNPSLNSGHNARPKKKKKTFHIMDFAVLADHRVKLKESGKIN